MTVPRTADEWIRDAFRPPPCDRPAPELLPLGSHVTLRPADAGEVSGRVVAHNLDGAVIRAGALRVLLPWRTIHRHAARQVEGTTPLTGVTR